MMRRRRAITGIHKGMEEHHTANIHALINNTQHTNNIRKRGGRSRRRRRNITRRQYYIEGCGGCGRSSGQKDRK
eukprot:7913411-Heterocapsa_arctica.AAC.1